ncbi:hypothetical protein [Mailhella sp.]|uniref:hypothetical protein n=1 Tax=Mailhella sp. TaxID=1981029 RepID=UPI003AB43529
MEKMLLKMARQLNAMDEASLMALWNKYMQRVQNFDASREWEEATIALSLIQAVRGKNQLFNTKWEEREALKSFPEEPRRDDLRPWRRMPDEKKGEKTSEKPRAKVHQFRPLA